MTVSLGPWGTVGERIGRFYRLRPIVLNTLLWDNSIVGREAQCFRDNGECTMSNDNNTTAANVNQTTVRASLTLSERRAKAKATKATSAAREAKAKAKAATSLAKFEAGVRARFEAKNTAAAEKASAQPLDDLISFIIKSEGKALESKRSLAVRLTKDLGTNWWLIDGRAKGVVLGANEKSTWLFMEDMRKRLQKGYVAIHGDVAGKDSWWSRVKALAAIEYRKSMGLPEAKKEKKGSRDVWTRTKEDLRDGYNVLAKFQNETEDATKQALAAKVTILIGQALNLLGVDLSSMNEKA